MKPFCIRYGNYIPLFISNSNNCLFLFCMTSNKTPQNKNKIPIVAINVGNLGTSPVCIYSDMTGTVRITATISKMIAQKVKNTNGL